MCGIAGLFDFNHHLSFDQKEHYLTQMAQAQAHRGPDMQGLWFDQTHQNVALAHRRLSILDLSESGKQPMTSKSGRFVMTYNGEVYNFQILKNELLSLGHSFKGTSDTEILLSAFEQWGIEKTLEKANGMFALALYDKETKTLTLARDRIGKKPLYYGIIDGVLYFASELKALSSLPHFKKDLNKNSLNLFTRYNYIPAPYSIFNDVYKLSAGCVISLTQQNHAHPTHEKKYWDLKSIAQEKQLNPSPISYQDALKQLDEKITSAVEKRMMSDVPLGAFLSGGIDSSLVVAKMSQLSDKPIETFTIGFKDPQYNEANHAKEIAHYLGTNHHEKIIDEQDLFNVINSLPHIYCEPFSDSSQIPTLIVSGFAKEFVTVALSGDGGDESFAGYTRYQWMNERLSKIAKLPKPLRALLKTSLHAFPPALWDKIGLGRLTSVKGERLETLKNLLLCDHQKDFYQALQSHWKEPNRLVLGSQDPQDVYHHDFDFPDFTHSMMLYDSLQYLPDDIMVKVDRASMAHSLEARAPLLDYELIEWAWNMPASYKYHKKQGKRLLRDLLGSYLPSTLYDRPKKGFSVPINEWLRGSLKEEMCDLLSFDRLKTQNILDPHLVEHYKQQHLSGHSKWGPHLWDLLLFQKWLDHHI